MIRNDYAWRIQSELFWSGCKLFENTFRAFTRKDWKASWQTTHGRESIGLLSIMRAIFLSFSRAVISCCQFQQKTGILVHGPWAVLCKFFLVGYADWDFSSLCMDILTKCLNIWQDPCRPHSFQWVLQTYLRVRSCVTNVSLASLSGQRNTKAKIPLLAAHHTCYKYYILASCYVCEISLELYTYIYIYIYITYISLEIYTGWAK